MSMQVVKHLFKASNRVVNVRDGGINGQKRFDPDKKKPCDRAQGFFGKIYSLLFDDQHWNMRFSQNGTGHAA